MSLKLEDFKTAALRVFYDVINADGIIDDAEIRCLEKYKADYGFLCNDGTENLELVRKAHKLTFSQALNILKEWKKQNETNSHGEVITNPNLLPKHQNTREFYNDVLSLATCDGGCSEKEALLLLALDYVLHDDNVDDEVAKIISCKKSGLKFAGNEIIYVEHEFDDEFNEELQNSEKLSHIKSLLKLMGFDFVYIPDVANFLNCKNQNLIDAVTPGSLLSKMMLFTHPLSFQNAEHSARFAKELTQVKTAEFINDYLCDCEVSPEIVPSIMVKVKTSCVPEVGSNGSVTHNDYVDFLLITIDNEVLATVMQFAKNYIALVKSLKNSVEVLDSNRVACRAFHKTLMDYVVNRSMVQHVNKVIFDMSRKSNYLVFDGIAEHAMPPARFLLYMLIVAESQDRGVICKSGDKQSMEQQQTLFKRMQYATELKLNYDQMKSYVSKIKEDILTTIWLDKKSFLLPDKKTIPDTNDVVYRIDAPIDMFYIKTRDGEECPLEQWIEQLR